VRLAVLATPYACHACRPATTIFSNDCGGSFRSRFPIRNTTPTSSSRFLRALDKVDTLKSQAPMLGAAVDPNYETAGKSRLELNGRSLEEVIPLLVKQLDGDVHLGASAKPDERHHAPVDRRHHRRAIGVDL